MFIKFSSEKYAPEWFAFRCLLSLAEGQRFAAVQHYDALPEEAEVEELVTPVPVNVGILMNKLFPDLQMTHTFNKTKAQMSFSLDDKLYVEQQAGLFNFLYILIFLRGENVWILFLS